MPLAHSSRALHRSAPRSSPVRGHCRQHRVPGMPRVAAGQRPRREHPPAHQERGVSLGPHHQHRLMVTSCQLLLMGPARNALSMPDPSTFPAILRAATGRRAVRKSRNSRAMHHCTACWCACGGHVVGNHDEPYPSGDRSQHSKRIVVPQLRHILAGRCERFEYQTTWRLSGGLPWAGSCTTRL